MRRLVLCLASLALSVPAVAVEVCDHHGWCWQEPDTFEERCEEDAPVAVYEVEPDTNDVEDAWPEQEKERHEFAWDDEDGASLRYRPAERSVTLEEHDRTADNPPPRFADKLTPVRTIPPDGTVGVDVDPPPHVPIPVPIGAVVALLIGLLAVACLIVFVRMRLAILYTRRDEVERHTRATRDLQRRLIDISAETDAVIRAYRDDAYRRGRTEGASKS